MQIENQKNYFKKNWKLMQLMKIFFETKTLPSYTVSSGNNVIIGNEAGSAMETTLVHEPRHPRVFIRDCRSSTDDSILLIRYTAFWKQFLHHCCPLRDIVARGAGSTQRRFLPWTVTSVGSARSYVLTDVITLGRRGQV